MATNTDITRRAATAMVDPTNRPLTFLMAVRTCPGYEDVETLCEWALQRFNPTENRPMQDSFEAWDRVWLTEVDRNWVFSIYDLGPAGQALPPTPPSSGHSSRSLVLAGTRLTLTAHTLAELIAAEAERCIRGSLGGFCGDPAELVAAAVLAQLPEQQSIRMMQLLTVPRSHQNHPEVAELHRAIQGAYLPAVWKLENQNLFGRNGWVPGITVFQHIAQRDLADCLETNSC